MLPLRRVPMQQRLALKHQHELAVAMAMVVQVQGL